MALREIIWTPALANTGRTARGRNGTSKRERDIDRHTGRGGESESERERERERERDHRWRRQIIWTPALANTGRTARGRNGTDSERDIDRQTERDRQLTVGADRDHLHAGAG
jgi:hypothetical protein